MCNWDQRPEFPEFYLILVNIPKYTQCIQETLFQMSYFGRRFSKIHKKFHFIFFFVMFKAFNCDALSQIDFWVYN